MAGLGALDSLAEDLSSTLIKEFGGTADFIVENVVSSGDFSAPTTTSTYFKDIRITPPSINAKELNDRAIKDGDCMLYVEPKLINNDINANNTFVIIDGVKLKITEVENIYSGNRKVLLKVYANGNFIN